MAGGEAAARPRHIAVVAPPLPGHWDPLRVLAAELVRRDHRVTFVHMTDADSMIRESELGFEPVGAESHGVGALSRYRDCLARAGSWGGFLPMLRATAAISTMLLDSLPGALARLGADAVIADETEPAGAMVARLMGLPYVTSITGLPLLRDPAVPPPFVGWRYRADDYGRRRNANGYAIADRLMRPIRKALAPYEQAWGLAQDEVARGSPLLQVAQCPRDLDFPREELPPSFRYCGPFRRIDQEVLDLAADERPLVYCSLGSLQGNRPRLFAAMTAACADGGARAVVAHGGLLDEAAARALPGEPLVRAFWQQPAILPRCAAAILHGGFNTVLDALAAGVPMVVAPLAFEQPGTAARIAQSGAGVVIKGRLSRRRLRSRLASILNDNAYGVTAAGLAGEIRNLGGASLAADLIEEALRTGRTPDATA